MKCEVMFYMKSYLLQGQYLIKLQAVLYHMMKYRSLLMYEFEHIHVKTKPAFPHRKAITSFDYVHKPPSISLFVLFIKSPH